MKRIILSFALFTIFYSLFSQEYKIIDTLGNFLNNDTFIVNGLVTDYQIIVHLWVINTDTQQLDVKVKKDTIYTISGSTNDFCWAGLCYPSTTFISTNMEEMNPGDTSKEFSAHYKPFGNIGNTLIKYIFFSSHPTTGDTVYVLYKVISCSNLSMTTSVTNADCGQSNGTATTNPSSGTSPYTYQWSNGQITQIATDLAVGTYNVTVTDANGCTETATVLVNNIGIGDSTLTITSIADTNGCSGTATISAADGAPPYSYLWNNGQTTQTATGLCADTTYFVTITDVNGCIASDSVNIVGTDINEYEINNFISSFMPNPANTYTSFSYCLKNNRNVKIVIYNILGNQMQSIPLMVFPGKLTVNTEEFSPGIYFCALLADDKMVSMRKLIISR
ncbi:MAG: T9SS type A sorting domain-containing protein [Bacteroidia bacterium]|nr:T9SS type A sorting domain-containing protein [Bacteroidia bacterium]